MDLFDNPMVDAARKALTPEQIQEYKTMGEYMYNSTDYKATVESASVRESKDEDLILYAVEALKSGGDPHDLSEPEIQALIKTYGNEWYLRFNLEENEVPKPKIQEVTADQILEDAKKKAKMLPRKKRRALQRKIAKLEKSKK